MKIILIPLFKYTFSIIIGVYILILTLCFYPIAVIWEFEFMSWGEYMVYNYVWGTTYQQNYILNKLEKESFFDTMKRWVNLDYTLFLIQSNND